MRRARHLAACLLLVGLVGCTGAGRTAAAPTASPSPTPSPTQPPWPPVWATPSAYPTQGPRGGPPVTDWLAGLATDGTALYVTAHRCPAMVEQGHCTYEGAFPPPIDPRPLTLWRYADGRWTRLSRPGVDSYAELHVARGGLVLVPRSSELPLTGTVPRPLRVSVDGGRSWQSWAVPEPDVRCTPSGEPDFGPCTVVVAGRFVVVASNYGWIRRSLTSRGWEDITPPRRTDGPSNSYGFGYGVLGLPDGTVVATVNPIYGGEGGGSFRVLRAGSTTWSEARDNPGGSSQIMWVEGSTVVAACWVPGSGVVNVKDATSCGQYLSTDLRRWTRIATPPVPDPDHGKACVRRVLDSDRSWRESALSLRVGGVVYSITNVPFVNGQEAYRETLTHLDDPHLVRHVLERSSDDCRSWKEVLR